MMRSPRVGCGRISPWCVLRVAAVAGLHRDAFTTGRRLQNIRLKLSQALIYGKIYAPRI